MADPKKNILIVSPHPDDDVIGMGGTIAVRSDEGYYITIVYVTNGGGSIKTDDYKDLSKENLIALRKEEAKRSILPLVDDISTVTQIFLDLESSTLFSVPEKFTSELEKLLRAKEYSEVYIPYYKDKHPTHRVVADLSEETIKDGGYKVALYAYETWDALPSGNETIAIDISSHYKNKLSAVSCHKSQCSITPFDEGIIAKNRYNAVFYAVNSKNKMEYAELFLKRN